ncbi:acetate/propionate family kinase [Nitrosovibrio tenuis]|uniref:Acetate kinase n=1 Tax=Nitrosovibrio tenuis TaxID=1233 RepID=A0A1H7KPW5_9PROT|nr:acetate/propionate family kinase [Nitrosovibrio tenuis]SEK88095.1 acetate kinase [Nitrosovibrio tenuis]
MTILTVNTGSSSVRLAAFTRDGGTPREIANARDDLSAGEPQAMLGKFLKEHGLAKINAAAHRVVHGGRKLTTSCLLDQEVEQEIDRLAPLAPLHNPIALHWIRATREALGAGISQVAVFDTAFFTALPEIARTYAIPHELAKKHGLYRYGFHGLAHQAMWLGWRDLKPDTSNEGADGRERIISMQLGAGCSITAIENGMPRDTSMGFSPLEGLMMATRSGDIDPGLITYLQRQEGLAPEQLDELLNERSGLLGLSQRSGDIRQLLESVDVYSRLAVDLYCYRARKYLGAYFAVLGGAKAIIFGGGVGENVAAIREKILAGMQWCGIEINRKKNHDSTGISRISSDASQVEVWVIPVDEAAILAREAARVLDHPG